MTEGMTNRSMTIIHDIPKAELHLHLEGSLEPELMVELAQRNGVQLPYGSVEEIRSAYQFDNLQSFLDLYYAGMNVLRREQDFYDLTWAYLHKAASQGVKHCEVFFDPQAHTDRGIAFDTVHDGIVRALQAAPQLGLTAQLIMCFNRHLSPESAMATLAQAIPHKDTIVAVGLDSSERDYPPALFQAVFEKALEEGFLTVAHAGEEGPPDYIWQAIRLLKVSRIDHGVRCVEDPQLVNYLAETQLPLTVCPLSNIKLCVFDRLADHNLKQLLHQGLCATVNSDDPSYFGGYILENYQEVQAALNLSPAEICQLAKNSFQASFLSEADKQPYLQQIEAIGC